MPPSGDYLLRIAPVAAREATANKKTMQNVSTLLTILMALAVWRYDTVHIAQRRRFLAFLKATKRHHWASTCSNNINWTCLPPFWSESFILRSSKKGHIARWRWFVAFLKATKRCHPASTSSDITQSDMLTPDFGGIFHRQINKKGLELTFWLLITIGVWHIKLMEPT